MLPLTFSKALYDNMVDHCRSKYPKEACGILAGSAGRSVPTGQERLVLQLYPMTNVEDSPIGYSMDPKEQLTIEKQMRQRNQGMLGIYHSHTASDAYPSSVDVRLAVSPDISYVLVSLKDQDRPMVKSYRIDGGKVTPEPGPLIEEVPTGLRRIASP